MTKNSHQHPLSEARPPNEKPRRIGPKSNGQPLTPEAFDAATFAPGWRYELANGVLIVNH